jgi:hypothetical protein
VTCRSPESVIHVTPTRQYVAQRNTIESRIKTIQETLAYMGCSASGVSIKAVSEGRPAETMEITMECMDQLLNMANGSQMCVGTAVMEDVRRQAAEATTIARLPLVVCKGPNNIGYEYVEGKGSEKMSTSERAEHDEKRMTILKANGFWINGVWQCKCGELNVRLPCYIDTEETTQEGDGEEFIKITKKETRWTIEDAGDAGHRCTSCGTTLNVGYLHTVVKFPEASSQEEKDAYKERTKQKAKDKLEAERKEMEDLVGTWACPKCELANVRNKYVCSNCQTKIPDNLKLSAKENAKVRGAADDSAS